MDLDRAKRDAQGCVEFSADVFILQPKDVSRGSRVALSDVPNRGRKMLLRTFNHATQATVRVPKPTSAMGFFCARAIR